MNIYTKIYSQKSLKQLNHDLECLGKDTKYDLEKFCKHRILLTITIFILLILFAKHGYLVAPFASILFYHLFYYFNITKKLEKKSLRLEHESLYFFEILTLTLESGRNLEEALKVTCHNVNSEISDEFQKALDEVKYGKSLNEALNDMKRRMSSDTIDNIILNIIQTTEFGNSILDTLYNQVDFLREKQILEIKKQINKIPNKVSIISVIFIVPLIMVLILGPYLISILS
ncbi:MAG: type II secretion system F family protein [Bacilli bacterium]|nr:type II secretion system F family protein [Bacilli bacterium]MBR3209403.1 type II secretion system F family protein [Bacilli bacterium]